MTLVPPDDYRYQTIPVPKQLRGESFIRLNSEPEMLHPTVEAVEKWNSWHPYSPETVDTFRSALKKPAGKWKNPQYRFTADAIDTYRMHSPYKLGNYGIIPVTVTIMDIDNVELMEKEYGLISVLPKTFTVQSGRTSSVGNHVYLRVTDIPVNHPFYQNKIVFAGDRGDIRFSGHSSYVVGPYSMHPSGRRYLPVSNDVPIVSIAFSELLEIIRDIPVKEDDNRVLSLEDKIAFDRNHVNQRYSDKGNIWYHMIHLYNIDHPVLDMLTGYERVGNRLKSPESSPHTGAGVVIIYHDGAEKVLNYHEDDTYLNHGEGRIPTSSYDLLIKDEGEKEARNQVLAFIKKRYPAVYSLYKEQCHAYFMKMESHRWDQFVASVPSDPVTGEKIV